MKDVFLSYRRSDSSDIVGRIFDHLKARFGEERLFKDVDSIPLGEDFRTTISQSAAQCKVLLVVIGDDWLDAPDDNGGRRIDNPNDSVHLEIATALKHGVIVIPILVKNTAMPKATELPPALQELAYRNSISVRADPDFQTDLNRLSSHIASHLKAVSRRKLSVYRLTRAKVVVFGLAFIVACIAAFIIMKQGPNNQKRTSDLDSALLGRWEPTLENGKADHFLGDIVVTKPRDRVHITMVPPVKSENKEDIRLAHDSFDGTEWRFSWRDGNWKFEFVVYRLRDGLFEGTFLIEGDFNITDSSPKTNSEPEKHRIQLILKP